LERKESRLQEIIPGAKIINGGGGTTNPYVALPPKEEMKDKETY